MKTKTMKRLAAAVAAITMMSAVPLMGTQTSIFADSTLKVKTVDNEVHTYKAYQIFKGTLSAESGKENDLSDIEWGSAVKSGQTDCTGDILTLLGLAGDARTLGNAVDTISKKSSDEIQELSKLIYEKIKNNTASSVSSGDTGVSVEDGYYLLVDTTQTGYSALSANMMKVAGTVELTPKYSKPTLEKNILVGTQTKTETKANTAAIGDNVEYQLKSKVPNMTGYTQYYFVINDVLDEGLKLDMESFSVKVGNMTLDKTDNVKAPYDAVNSKGYYYVTSTTNGQGFKLVINDFINYADQTGADIIVTYNAELGGNGNDKVEYGTSFTAGNNNTANLVYSNNPNAEYTGSTSSGDTPSQDTPADKPYEPPMYDHTSSDDDNTENDPTDDTPKDNNVSTTQPDSVVTYTTKLKVFKTDKNGALTGAGFTLKLGNDIIKKIDSSDASEFVFEGLKPGDYTLIESDVPTGYTKADDLDFTISETIANNTYEISWQNDTNVSYVVANSEYEVTVLNKSGATLPSTGGIGTTIFYVSGGVLVLGAGVVLITKKRMSLKDDK